MSLSITVTPGDALPAGTPVDLATLRRVAQPAVNLAGSIGAAALVAGTDYSGNLSPAPFFFGAATLSGSTIEFSANGVPSPAPGAYVAGQTYCFLPNFACPAGGVTVNINSIGAANLYKNVSAALGANDFISGQLVWIQFDGTNFQLQGVGANAGGTTQGLAGWASGGSGTFTATQLIFTNAAGGTFLVQSVSVSGVSAVDTGSLTNGNWYYLWAVWNGTTVEGLWSLSATAPALPSGYFAQAMILPAYYTSSAFAAVNTVGRTAFLVTTNVYNGGLTTTNTYQSLSLSAYVPPIALTVQGAIGSASVSVNPCAIAGSNNGIGAQYNAGAGTATTSVDAFYTASNFSTILISAQTVYIKAYSTTGHNILVNITGYTF